MAASLNTVVVTGNLTRDPELRHTNSGTAVCSLRIAVNDSEKVNGEWTERANYFDVTVWGKQGESCATHLNKGSGVGVQGRLRWREWEKEGEKRQTVEIVADRVRFMGGKGDSSSNGGGSPAEADFATSGRGIDDDIPF